MLSFNRDAFAKATETVPLRLLRELGDCRQSTSAGSREFESRRVRVFGLFFRLDRFLCLVLNHPSLVPVAENLGNRYIVVVAAQLTIFSFSSSVLFTRIFVVGIVLLLATSSVA